MGTRVGSSIGFFNSMDSTHSLFVSLDDSHLKTLDSLSSISFWRETESDYKDKRNTNTSTIETQAEMGLSKWGPKEVLADPRSFFLSKDLSLPPSDNTIFSSKETFRNIFSTMDLDMKFPNEEAPKIQALNPLWTMPVYTVPEWTRPEDVVVPRKATPLANESVVPTAVICKDQLPRDTLDSLQFRELLPSKQPTLQDGSSVDFMLDYLKISVDSVVANSDGYPSHLTMRENNSQFDHPFNKWKTRFMADLPPPAAQFSKMMQLPTGSPVRPNKSMLSSHNEAAATTRVTNIKGPNNKKRKQKSNKKQETAKSHHPVPDHKEYITEYTDKHVLFGRGELSNTHPGNEFYRSLVKALKHRYVQVKGQTKKAREKKEKIVLKILNIIQEERGGNFLELDKASKRWYVAHPDAVKGKVKQCLRDKNDDPETRAAKRAKYGH